ncbi:hypothetical protein ACI513_06370 [Chryseobacterium sp. M5]|uniref:hypothetical protein n=1 Tax=Chryseobacterium sp. M5 TaxID=3379128 RepID=UPI003857D07C
MKKKLFFLFIIVHLFSLTLFSQRIEKENINLQLLIEPIFPTEAQNRNYSLALNSHYNISKEDVYRSAKQEYQKKLDQYNENIELAKKEHHLKLVEYDEEVKRLKEKFKLESEEYNKQKTIDKIVSTNGPPTINLPSRPELNVPPMPKYKEPDLKEALIVDNKVLESQLNVSGFSKNGNYLEIQIDMPRTLFQDNAGKTFANQPTKIIAKLNGLTKLDKTYFTDFVEIASSPTNEINLNFHEKMFLQNVLQKINTIINDNFGYQSINTVVTVENVKNKGDYDDLEKAYIYITTNLRKMQPKTDYAPNKTATENFSKGISLWNEALKKINYKDKKALYNEKIARYIYFNLIRINLALGKKSEAEKYLNELQEHLMHIKLDYDEKNELTKLENNIYN